MLKLDQIEILNSDEIIVEVMEPIVYAKSGSVIKSDETLAKEKANVFYTIATVVKVYDDGIEDTEFENATVFKNKSKRHLKVGDNLIVPRSQITPIQFPIESYDSPKLGVLNIYAPFAIVRDDI